MNVFICNYVYVYGPTLCNPIARLLCPWNSPGKNTGVGNHSLLQGIFLTHRSNLDVLYCRRILYHLSHQGSENVCWYVCLYVCECLYMCVYPWVLEGWCLTQMSTCILVSGLSHLYKMSAQSTLFLTVTITVII